MNIGLSEEEQKKAEEWRILKTGKKDFKALFLEFHRKLRKEGKSV